MTVSWFYVWVSGEGRAKKNDSPEEGGELLQIFSMRRLLGTNNLPSYAQLKE